MNQQLIEVSYGERDGERQLLIETDERAVVLSQPLKGYGMIVLSTVSEGTELERYYGLDMAIDHAAEFLRVPKRTISVPESAQDMGI